VNIGDFGFFGHKKAGDRHRLCRGAYKLM